VKDKHFDPEGLLQPPEIPKSKWNVISMNFIVGLPIMSRIHDSIFIVVENPMTSEYFIPMKTTYQALEIARVFNNEIIRLHGIPKR
jgi:hypothetical protein